MRVAIVDGDPDFGQKLKGIQQSYFDDREVNIQIDLYESAEQLLCAYTFYNIYFITVELSGIDGFELVKRLKKRREDAAYIFVSAIDENMQRAFFWKPYGFIRKKELDKDSKSVLLHLEKSIGQLNGTVMLYSGKKGWRIDPAQIVYCSSGEHYVYLYYKDDEKQREMLRMKLDELEEYLEEFGFLRIHRNYLINLHYVSKQDGKMVYLTDGIKIAISRRLRKEVERSLENWFGKKKAGFDK